MHKTIYLALFNFRETICGLIHKVIYLVYTRLITVHHHNSK